MKFRFPGGIRTSLTIALLLIVGGALGKIMRSLPAPVAAQAEAVRRATAPAPDRAAARPDP